MPKMKSNRAAMKRFRLSASGKIRRERANANHKFTSKSKDRKRRLRQITEVNARDKRRVRRMIVS